MGPTLCGVSCLLSQLKPLSQSSAQPRRLSSMKAGLDFPLRIKFRSQHSPSPPVHSFKCHPLLLIAGRLESRGLTASGCIKLYLSKQLRVRSSHKYCEMLNVVEGQHWASRHLGSRDCISGWTQSWCDQHHWKGSCFPTVQGLRGTSNSIMFKLWTPCYAQCITNSGDSVSPCSTGVSKRGEENPISTLSPKGTHPGSEPACPEQGTTGYAATALPLHTEMSQHREEIKGQDMP